MVSLTTPGLPPKPEGFVPRPVVQDVLREALISGPPLVVLAGMGGVGKTSLALNAAHPLVPSKFFRRAVWVPVHQGYATLETVLRVIAQMLGRADLAAGQLEELVRDVQTLLREQSILVVLDNLESSSTEDQRELVSFCANTSRPSRTLITSRHTDSLNDLPDGLPAPRVIHLGGLTAAEAVDFVHRESQRLNATDLAILPPTVMDSLFAATSGSPYALRWLIALSSGTSIGTLLTRLHQSDQEIFTAIFERSWGMLQQTEQDVLHAVAIIGAPISGSALAAALEREPIEVDTATQRVIELSLMDSLDILPDEDRLIDIHPLTRSFVIARFGGKGEAAALLRRAVSFYAGLARRHGGFLDVNGQRRLDFELPVIRRLVAWCAESGDQESVLDLTLPLQNLLWMRGAWRERLELGLLARHAAAASGNSVVEGCILSGDLGWTHLQLGEEDQAWSCLNAAVELLHAAGEGEEEANARRYQAQLARHQDDIVTARKLLGLAEQAAAKLEPWCSKYAQARICLDAGRLALAEAQSDEARQQFHRALTLFEDVGDNLRATFAQNGLGDVDLLDGNHEAARQRFAASLNTADRHGSEGDRARALLRLARVDANNGVLDQARFEAGEALTICRRIGLLAEARETEELLEQLVAPPPWLEVDPAATIVRVKGKEVHLELQALELLDLLHDRAPATCTYAEISAKLWGDKSTPRRKITSSVHPLIAQIRKAIGTNAKDSSVLQNVYGQGYRLVPPA